MRGAEKKKKKDEVHTAQLNLAPSPPSLSFPPSAVRVMDGWMHGEVVGWLMGGRTEREREGGEEEEKTEGVLLGH